MPSRAYTSFLPDRELGVEFWKYKSVNALSGLYIISTRKQSSKESEGINSCVNALSGLYIISTGNKYVKEDVKCHVSMPSRAYTSFLRLEKNRQPTLMRVSMPSRAYTSFLRCPKSWTSKHIICVNALSGLYIISTDGRPLPKWMIENRVNALSGLYIISTVPLQKPRFYAASRTCFCRYLSEYSDNSRFSCMLTFWTYLMRCTYP